MYEISEFELDRRKVLCVGLCCVDVISVCETYPEEDTDQRSLDYYWQRGGNATNTSTVLALLDANVEFFGTLVKSQELKFLEDDFARHNINIENCVRHEEGQYKCPVAIVILSKQTASRTIVAALSKCPQLTVEDFTQRIQVNKYKWIHFEGCPNVDNMRGMMEHIAKHNQECPCDERLHVSLELEKPKRSQLIQLAGLVDCLFVSKEFGRAQGYSNMVEVVENMVSLCKPGAKIICAWGEKGAAAKTTSGETVTSPIFPPETLVDTLGAGDTFNGAAIYALSQGFPLKESIVFACKVAGAKCGMVGTDGLKGKQILL